MPSSRILTHSRIRCFSTTSAPSASVLFALGALSNSRETQHFNKLSRLQRVEHSPPLKLIKTSEVDPFPLPTPPEKSPDGPLARDRGITRFTERIWSSRALAAGRTILADNARVTLRMRRAAQRAKWKEEQARQTLARELEKWTKERRKMRNEMRAAGVWILLSVGTATALAMWRFWPQAANSGVKDSGEMGRRIAERAKAAMPLPAISAAAASSPIGVTRSTTGGIIAEASPGNLGHTKSKKGSLEGQPTTGENDSSWWKSLFWKQS